MCFFDTCIDSPDNCWILCHGGSGPCHSFKGFMAACQVLMVPWAPPWLPYPLIVQGICQWGCPSDTALPHGTMIFCVFTHRPIDHSKFWSFFGARHWDSRPTSSISQSLLRMPPYTSCFWNDFSCNLRDCRFASLRFISIGSMIQCGTAWTFCTMFWRRSGSWTFLPHSSRQCPGLKLINVSDGKVMKCCPPGAESNLIFLGKSTTGLWQWVFTLLDFVSDLDTQKQFFALHLYADVNVLASVNLHMFVCLPIMNHCSRILFDVALWASAAIFMHPCLCTHAYLRIYGAFWCVLCLCKYQMAT